MQEQQRRRRVRRYSIGFSGCMLGVAVLAPLIKPNNWAAWTALELLAAALVCAGRVIILIRRD